MQADLWRRVALWRDERRRAKKLMRRVRTADAAVLSIEKSGRTWLRAMVSHVYHQRYDVAVGELIDFDNFHAQHAAIPRILFTHVPSYGRSPSGRTWAEEFAAVERIVLLTRDPRDVAVSYYFQMTERAAERELWRKGVASRTTVRQMKLVDFLLDPRLGVPRVVRFTQAWREAIAAHPQTLTVSYEELRSDTFRTFARVAIFLDPETDTAEIAGAATFGDFATMQAREQDGFFASKRLQAKGASPDGRKVRRGKVGGYRDYLSAEEILTVDRLLHPSSPGS